MVRPQKEINWEMVEKRMEAGCTVLEISAILRINHDTFYKRFKQHYGASYQDYKAKFHSAGEADLKYMQHAKALNNKAPGNIQMLIWLGKVRLGQREPELLSQTPANQPQIDQNHLIMELQHKIAELEANANKPETE